MAKTVQFKDTLEGLFTRRTYWLRHVIGKRSPGAPPVFSKENVDGAIKKLQGIASAALATKLARTEFSRSIDKKKSWQVKGYGRKAKKRIFKAWFDEHIPYRSCIYAFWKGRKCVYVGRTREGVGRPSSHFNIHWFNGITRIDIYALRGRRSLPALECLAIHRFQPKENENRAQKAKWTKRCPLCKVHRSIKAELTSIFATRRRRSRKRKRAA